MILRKPLLRPDGTLDLVELSMRGRKDELFLRLLDLGIRITTAPALWLIKGIAWTLRS